MNYEAGFCACMIVLAIVFLGHLENEIYRIGLKKAAPWSLIPLGSTLAIICVGLFS